MEMSINLGEMIRRARLERGLTQRQLAGTEMTRSFVSLVEANKAKPSLRNLMIISQRLNKPIEFFLSEEADYRESVRTFLSTSRHYLDLDDMEKARTHAEQAAKISSLCSESVLQADAYLVLGKILMRMRELDPAFEYLEGALDIYQQLNARERVTETLLSMGNCCYLDENYHQALRYYQKSALRSEHLKRQTQIFAQAMVYKGTTHYRLGELAESAQAYEKAMIALQPLKQSKLLIDCILGLGWTCFKQGDTHRAIEITQRGIHLSEACDRHLYAELKHNLAIFQFHLSHYQEAYALWNECLEMYIASNKVIKQASVKEDLAQYWLRFERYDTAKQLCEEGLSLLDITDSTVQRGRLFRLLSNIYSALGNPTMAAEIKRLAIESFRRVRAKQELRETNIQC